MTGRETTHSADSNMLKLKCNIGVYGASWYDDQLTVYTYFLSPRQSEARGVIDAVEPSHSGLTSQTGELASNSVTVPLGPHLWLCI